jgi:hypothetical protein
MDRDEFLDYAILEIDYRVDPELRDDSGKAERPYKPVLALPATIESHLSWDEAMDKLHATIAAHLTPRRSQSDESIDIDDSASC